MTLRNLPSSLTRPLDRLNSAPPLEALGSSHAVHQALAGWQVTLVKEAIASGASWDDIGSALGTTRQGAWSRFRDAIDETQGEEAMDDRRQKRQRAKEMWNAGHERLREMDAKWTTEQASLRRQVEESRARLDEARRRHVRDKRAARDEMRREIAAMYG